MTAAERAKALWEDEDAFEKCRPDDTTGVVWQRVIASVIRAAENDALERAAARADRAAEEDAKEPRAYVIARHIAARIRAMKTGGTR